MDCLGSDRRIDLLHGNCQIPLQSEPIRTPTILPYCTTVMYSNQNHMVNTLVYRCVCLLYCNWLLFWDLIHVYHSFMNWKVIPFWVLILRVGIILRDFPYKSGADPGFPRWGANLLFGLIFLGRTAWKCRKSDPRSASKIFLCRSTTASF